LPPSFGLSDGTATIAGHVFWGFNFFKEARFQKYQTKRDYLGELEARDLEKPNKA